MIAIYSKKFTMWTRRAMKFEGVSKLLRDYTVRNDYEHEHRDAEYEHEEIPDQNDADQSLGRPFLACVVSAPRAR
jgi:hypothetical protein